MSSSPINPKQTDNLGMILAMLLLRLWLAARAIVAGIEKFAGSESSSREVLIDGVPNEYGLTEASSQKVYAFSNYQGVPGPLADRFANEPLIPAWGLTLYDWILGPALLILGITLLLGIASRISLFAMGLLYTSLTFGLILINQDAGVAWLGTHIILIVFALTLSQHNRFVILKKW
jgi:thiosulfate dehydrogenase [quinone] large subunit